MTNPQRDALFHLLWGQRLPYGKFPGANITLNATVANAAVDVLLAARCWMPLKLNRAIDTEPAPPGALVVDTDSDVWGAMADGWACFTNPGKQDLVLHLPAELVWMPPAEQPAADV